METVIFDCPCGQVKGKKVEDAYIFKGLPYAKTERFKLPEIINEWGETFDGTIGEIDCPQFSTFYDESDSFYTKEFRNSDSFPMNNVYAESPMTLNIITPGKEEKKPVLAFFHGGGFETGTVGELPYGECLEYAKRDVVFVSVGYRLNIFGLYGGVNYGLADLVTSINWIRNNIESFGGDPEKITIMGQSAGAMSIIDLLCSECLRGKIKGAIMMSLAGVVPSLGAPLSKEKAKKFWDEVTNQLKDKDVYKASSKELFDAWQKVRSKQGMIEGFRHMQPCIDGVNPPESQSKRVDSGKILDVPMMVGVTSQDCIPYFIFDMALSLGIKTHKLNHKAVYGYFFDRTLPGNSYKAFHACDLWYMFGNMDKSWRPFEKVDYDLSKKMIDNVAEFVKTGKPLDDKWLAISSNQKCFKLFDGEHDEMIKPSVCRKKLLHTTFKEPGPI